MDSFCLSGPKKSKRSYLPRLGVKDRLDYALGLGAIAVVTSEVGSGKSTALRFATHHLHPSEWLLLRK